MAFAKSVFVNCPFDEDFYPLLRPLLFTIIYLRLKPRIALETTDSGESRLAKIVRLIADSNYAIHDLTRMEALKVGELYRLNMPFELGVDFGCRHFGSDSQRARDALSWKRSRIDTKRRYPICPGQTLRAIMTSLNKSSWKSETG